MGEPMEQVTLPGRYVRLEPMRPEHHAGLTAAAMEPEIWKYPNDNIRTAEDMRGYMDRAMEAHRDGVALPFATIDRRTGQVAGSTRFAAYDPPNRRVEIGWTWLGATARRTAINTEAKWLMLRYAFETLSCVRVEFKTDALNDRSRNAILRLGAKEEGTLRKHMLLWSGRYRDSVYFGILDTEWPQVRERLESFLSRPEKKNPGS